MHHGDPRCLRGVVRLLLICDLVQERMQFVVDRLDLVCPIFRRRQDWLIRCSEEGVSFCLVSGQWKGYLSRGAQGGGLDERLTNG